MVLTYSQSPPRRYILRRFPPERTLSDINFMKERRANYETASQTDGAERYLGKRFRLVDGAERSRASAGIVEPRCRWLDGARRHTGAGPLRGLSR